jgi:ubiquinone/menaquinone biosynthesis C-methylase UbiE
MTTAHQLDTSDLTNRVQQMYTDVAEQPSATYHFETGRALAERLGYPAADLDAIPGESIDSFAGVGYFLDLAAITGSDAVIDLGSGSGMDSFLVGLTARRVVGVDMTDAQLAKACRLCAGRDNIDFDKGLIDNLDYADETFDVAISNGVINLVPDKAAVFGVAARVLKPGGRLALADIVTESQLPEGVTCDASLWAACIGGAMQIDDYQAAITAAGFEITVGRVNDAYRFLSSSATNATQKWGVKSISLLAVKK